MTMTTTTRGTCAAQLCVCQDDETAEPRNDMEQVFGRPVARKLTAEQAAFLDGQSDGHEDGRMGEYRPQFSNPGLQARSTNHEIASAYADGYVAGWNAGQDLREACEIRYDEFDSRIRI